MMKKRMILTMTAVAMAAAMGLAGCSGNGGSQGGEGETKAEGTLADQSGAGDTQDAQGSDESDKLVGYDVEVAGLIAEKLGVKVTFVEGEWDGLFAGLDAGRYDMVINGVEVTDERREKYDFSEPYGYIRTAIIVDGGNMEIQSFEDLDGKKTANTISSTYAELAESYGAQVTAVDDLNQTFELLNTGRIDATLNAELTFYDYINAHPEKNLKIAALTDDASLVCIPMRKGEDSKSLREAVNKAIDEIRESGELAKLSDKYFGNDISQEPKKDKVTD